VRVALSWGPGVVPGTLGEVGPLSDARTWSAALLLLLLTASALPLAAVGQGAGVEYRLVVDCPETYAATGSSLGISCPVRATDPQDMMGDPSIAVDPLDPANLILASLHGGVHDGGAAGAGSATCPPGPTPKSRCGQVFTTFTSTDHGASWIDNPFTPPSEVGSDAYGEHPQVTIDPYGHVYVGSLYAMPRGNGLFDYVIAAQKFASIDTIDNEQDGEYHTQYLDPVLKGNAIRQMWFLFNAATDNMTIVWTETPQVPGEAQEEAQPGCLLPPPAPCIPPPAGAGRGRAASNHTQPQSPGAIGVVWSTSSTRSPYHYQDEEDAIAPCSRSTNPVLSEGWLYVGCVADPSQGEFRWNPRTAPGTVEMFRMDPNGGTPQYIGASPLIGGQPKLGVRSDGRLALVSAQATDGALSLDAVFGKYDGGSGRVAWGSVAHHGPKVAKTDPAIRVVEANVQDVIYREHSGVLHLLLKTRVQASGVGVTSATSTLAPHILKSIVAIDESHGVVTVMPLPVGRIENRTSDPAIMQAPELAYNDLSDDFLQLPLQDSYSYTDPNGVETVLGPAYAREFFAVGDYGQVMFAELIEITTLRGPAALPINAPPPPVPAAASSLNASAVLVPAVGVSVVGLMAAAFIANRRKDPAAAIAKNRK
jgi:hypothetical protein